MEIYELPVHYPPAGVAKDGLDGDVARVGLDGVGCFAFGGVARHDVSPAAELRINPAHSIELLCGHGDGTQTLGALVGFDLVDTLLVIADTDIPHGLRDDLGHEIGERLRVRVALLGVSEPGPQHGVSSVAELGRRAGHTVGVLPVTLEALGD